MLPTFANKVVIVGDLPWTGKKLGALHVVREVLSVLFLGSKLDADRRLEKSDRDDAASTMESRTIVSKVTITPERNESKHWTKYD